MENVKHPERVEGCGLPEYAHFNKFSVLSISNKLKNLYLHRIHPYRIAKPKKLPVR